MKKNNHFVLHNFLKLKSKQLITQQNPTNNQLRKDAEYSQITVYVFDENSVELHNLESFSTCSRFKEDGKNIWVNFDGLKREEVKLVCQDFGIHSLIEEDILSVGQRPKTDSFDDFVFLLTYMLSYNSENDLLEREQISMILGKNFVLTFQESPQKDAFTNLRSRLVNKTNKLRQGSADFLYYSLIDAIVDDYFVTMESFGEKIENGEDHIMNSDAKITMEYILYLRRELLLFRRTIYPSRDAISMLSKNENELFEQKTLRYLKDIYDHILQATEMIENYREGMSNLQDLHLNQANLKMNESMKVMAIVTCLLAPASVLGGIFGMNFSKIPFLHDPYGFYVCVVLMLLIPLWMILVFKKRGWF